MLQITMFIICRFCAGLRGEEIPMMSLGAMAKHYKKDQPVEESLSNVFAALRAQLKGAHSEDACHLIMIAASTETGLNPRLCVGQTIEAYWLKWITRGWVFRNDSGALGQQSDYEPCFFCMVQDIHGGRGESLQDCWIQRIMFQPFMGLVDCCIAGMPPTPHTWVSLMLIRKY
jgi:hypothetical protein